MRKLFRTKMLPLLLIMALIASVIDPGFIQPNVVYAAEESTAPQQGTQAASSIVLGKGTIEIDGHLFTDEEFQTFLSNAKIYRVPFEQSSTFALGDYGEIVGEDAQAAGGLVILSNAIIGVFQKLSVIFDLAELAGSGYVVIGVIGGVTIALTVLFFSDAIEINGVHTNSFNSALAGLTNFFVEHHKANPNEEIVNPDTGGTPQPGEDPKGDPGTEKRIYAPSPKHDPQGGWASINPIPNQEVGQELLDNAYSSSDSKQLYNRYGNDIIKFQPDGSSGEWHAYRVTNTSKEVPTDVYRQMLKDGVISKSDYNKLINNKWYQ